MFYYSLPRCTQPNRKIYHVNTGDNGRESRKSISTSQVHRKISLDYLSAEAVRNYFLYQKTLCSVNITVVRKILVSRWKHILQAAT